MSHLKSMTGFGIGEVSFEESSIVIQIRSWNRKGSDISIQLPSNYRDMEGSIREWLHSKVHRGSLQVYVECKGASRSAHSFDATCWQKVVEATKEAADLAEVPFKDLLLSVSSSWSHHMGCFHSGQSQSDVELAQKKILMALEKAFINWENFRLHEGQALGQTLDSLLKEIDGVLVSLAKATSQIGAKLTERLMKRLEALGVYEHIEPQRWQSEVALLADKSDVREEIDRLHMHVQHFRNCLIQGPFPVGRRLDFLSQEMVREANTLMNKCQDFEISQLGVDLKVSVDRLREQLQNVE